MSAKDAGEIIHVLYILWVYQKILLLEIDIKMNINIKTCKFLKVNETKSSKDRQTQLTFY